MRSVAGKVGIADRMMCSRGFGADIVNGGTSRGERSGSRQQVPQALTQGGARKAKPRLRLLLEYTCIMAPTLVYTCIPALRGVYQSWNTRVLYNTPYNTRV